MKNEKKITWLSPNTFYGFTMRNEAQDTIDQSLKEARKLGEIRVPSSSK